MPYHPDSPYNHPSYRANPYAWYARWRTEQPVTHTTLPSGAPVYVVTRYADVLAALKDARLIKNVYNVRHRGWLDQHLWRRFADSNMLKSDPPTHTRLRRLASDAFQPRRIALMRPGIEHIADALIERLRDKPQFDFVADFALPLPIHVISQMLGVPERDHARFHAWSNAIIASGVLSSERMVLTREMLALSRYMRRLIAERRRNPGDDVVSQLIAAEVNGERLSQTELVVTTILLLIAGHETTVNLLGNGLLALLQHPTQWQMLCADLARIPAAVEELLRLVNPVQLVNRYAAEDVEIAGVIIPRGSHVQLVIAAANHDAAVFLQTDTLNIAAETGRHLAFSQGIHYCLGAPLARLEGVVAFERLTQRMPTLQLATPDMIEWRAGLELRGLVRLLVRQ
jgi:cytochrome P450